MPTKKSTKKETKQVVKRRAVKIAYRLPYQTKKITTNDYNEAAYLFTHHQADLLEVSHGKKGKRVLVCMTYLNTLGGFETALLTLAKT